MSSIECEPNSSRIYKSTEKSLIENYTYILERLTAAATQVASKPSLGAVLARAEKLKRQGKVSVTIAPENGAGENMGLSARADEDFDKIPVPSVRCSNDDVFLLSNVDFMAAHILYGYAADPNQEETQRFIKHLNDCHRCFEAYCEIMRDYHFEQKKDQVGDPNRCTRIF